MVLTLSLCRLAEMMGGSMAVKSVLGQGADFIFYLKTTKTKYVENKEAAKSRLRHPKFAHRTGLTQTLSNRSSFSTAASTETPSTISGDQIRTASPLVIETYPSNTNVPLSPPVNNRSHLRVLVCEDNLLNQKLLYRQLTKAGIETTVANNGLEAIDKLLQSVREGRPMNVCLMDLEMPVCGGIEATTRIRALEREGELPGNLIIYAVT
jgi:CheY-like chemotaxis protein